MAQKPKSKVWNIHRNPKFDRNVHNLRNIALHWQLNSENYVIKPKTIIQLAKLLYKYPYV